MLEKNFDQWNVYKKDLDGAKSAVNAKEGAVWFCSIGINIGHEQDGKHHYFERPVLIVRRWTIDCFLGVPLTSKEKGGDYFCPILLLGRHSTAILIQMRLFDIRRLSRSIGMISDRELFEVRHRLAGLITKADPPVMADPRVHNNFR